MPTLLQLAEKQLLSASILAKLEVFLDLILEWNDRINLTGYRSRGEIEELLIGESVLAGEALGLQDLIVMDFGSGAGIPGLVWAICYGSARVTSVEVRHKKVSFQKEVVRSVGVSAEIIRGRFPEAVAGRRFDIIASRAIRFSPELWVQASSCLRPGGRVVRFVRPGVTEPGWNAMSLTNHSSLLVRIPA